MTGRYADELLAWAISTVEEVGFGEEVDADALVLNAARSTLQPMTSTPSTTATGTATFTLEGHLTVTSPDFADDDLGWHDMDGGEWVPTLDTILRAHGYTPIGTWRQGPNWDATITVRFEV